MTKRDAVRGGFVPPENGSHEAVVAEYSDELLVAVIADCGRRNLRDQRNHETRWLSERMSAARFERRKRQAAGTWTLELPKRGKKGGGK